MIDLFTSAALFFALDQLSKSLVEVRVGSGSIPVGRLFRLRHVANSSRLYGSDVGRVTLMALWVGALLSTIALNQIAPAFQSRAAMIALGAALGGAAGNLSDILRTRSVFDFIDLKFWPTFNLADVAIVCGLIVAFWAVR